MVAMTAEEKLEFVLIILKHSGKPDLKSAAPEVGMTRSDNVGTKLKKIIEDTGKFTFSNGVIASIDKSDDADVPATPMKVPATPKAKTPRTPKAPKTPKTPKSSTKDSAKDSTKDSTKQSASKKRKTSHDEDEEEPVKKFDVNDVD